MTELLSKDHPILEKGLMEYPPYGTDVDGRRIRDVSGITIRANVEYLEEVLDHTQGTGAGRRAVEQLCNLLNERIQDSAYHVSPTFLRNIWNSYSYEFACFLGEFCQILTGDTEFQGKVGREKFISPTIQTLGRPFTVSQIYKMFPHFGEKFAKDSLQFGVVQVTESSAILRMSFSDRLYRQFGPWRKRCAELICQASQAGLAAVPQRVHHLQPATVTDRACIAHGADHCEWEFTWTPHALDHFPWQVAILATGLGIAAFFYLYAGPPSAPFLFASGIAVGLTTLTWLAPNFYRLRRAMTTRAEVIQEQLRFVEARHEELREASLEQEHTSVALRHKFKQLTILHRAGLLLGSTFDREHLINQVLHALLQDLHYDRAMISFFDQKEQVVLDSRLCGVSPEIAEHARTMKIPILDPESVEGTVLLQGKSVLVGDIFEAWDRLHPFNQELARITRAKSLIAVPLKAKGRILGSLTVDRTREQSLTQDDLDVMTTLANQFALSLDNARAYHQIEELNVGLEGEVLKQTSALKKANRDLEAANTKLQEMDQRKSSFVSIVSHELRTPMTSIKGYVENMLDGLTGPLTARQDHYLNRVRHNAERLTRIINQLLDLSRIEAGQIEIQPAVLSPSDLAKDVVEELQSLAREKHIALISEHESSIPAIQADRDKLHQVLVNLTQNAIKFTPKGGTIRITSEAREDGFLQLSVVDTGCGIPDLEREKIFLNFYRGTSVRPEARGAGLGLAITKNLVELQGGHIWVESTPGEGSRFCFTLPVSGETGGSN